MDSVRARGGRRGAKMWGASEETRKAEDRVEVSGGVGGLDRIGEPTPHFRADGGARALAETDKNEFRGKSKEIAMI